MTREGIIRRLQELSDEMLEIATAMDYFGGFGAMGEHGRELAGAAGIVRGWARHLSGEGNADAAE